MLNNLSKYSPYNPKDFIVNGKSYRANPNNVYHEYYQASVNRWFMFFIVLCILLSVLLFRGPVVLLGVIGAAISIFVLIYFSLNMLVGIMKGFLSLLDFLNAKR